MAARRARNMMSMTMMPPRTSRGGISPIRRRTFSERRSILVGMVVRSQKKEVRSRKLEGQVPSSSWFLTRL